jgi:anionic cell wall polymer biosynthesis LytR-Cps2A-Psr (LCP) family protein
VSGNSTSERSPAARPRHGRRDRSVLLLVVILVGVAVAIVVAAVRLRSDELTDRLQTDRQLAVLVVLGAGTGDVFFEVVFLNADTRRAALLHVPGNVGVLVPGDGAESRARVDALRVEYEPGQNEGLLQALSTLLDTEVSIHLDLTGERLQRFVDLIGGVEIFIPNPVDTRSSGLVERGTVAGDATFAPASRDRTQDVLLPSGSILLDGEKATAYLSLELPHESRQDRANRAHRLVQASMKSIGDNTPALGRPTARRFLYQLVGSDLTARGFATLVELLASVDAERVIFQNVLGSPQDVDGGALLFPFYDGELVRETVSQIADNLRQTDAGQLAEINPSVEVLNGTDVSGLARRAATLLQSYGYEIVRIDNANHDEYTNSVVIDRRGKLESAVRLAGLLSCGRTVTEFNADGDAAVDVTVLLGGDFDGRRCTN